MIEPCKHGHVDGVMHIPCPDCRIEQLERDLDETRAKYERLQADFRARCESAPRPEVAASMKPVAWMRRWAFDGVKPEKIKINGRWRWSVEMKMRAITAHKCFDTDVPLCAIEQQTPPQGRST